MRATGAHLQSDAPIKLDAEQDRELAATGTVVARTWIEDESPGADAWARSKRLCAEVNAPLLARRRRSMQRVARRLRDRDARRLAFAAIADVRRREREATLIAFESIVAGIAVPRFAPRPIARRRRDCGARRSTPDRGDPDEDADELVGDLERPADLLEVCRAGFIVLRGWTYARFHAALDAAVDARRVFALDDGTDVWLVRR